MSAYIKANPHLDLRTTTGQERAILIQVRDKGGFSIFWVTANQRRAIAATKLVDIGALVPIKKAPYPWCDHEIDWEKVGEEYGLARD